MESPPSSIQTLIKKIKKEMFSTVDLYSFVSKSAYETAWLAMVPDIDQQSDQPMFKGCLDWVLNNQKEEGFWGESGADAGAGAGNGPPTIDSLPATLACMVALAKWNVGGNNIKNGLEFIRKNTERLLKDEHHHLPRWLAIVFPAMVELAESIGLDVLTEELKESLSDVFNKRQQILEMEELIDDYHNPPLLSYLEALQSKCDIDPEVIVRNLSKDGSLFQSPSATACAFMATGERKCKNYLQSLVRRCPHGVPPMYPMDEELIKLGLVDQIRKLGVVDHFNEEIKDILSEVYRSYKKLTPPTTTANLKPAEIYRNSLSFRLLRMHGYNVTPWSFCWIMHREDILAHMENNSENYTSAMISLYRATDVMFSGEYELKEARSISKKLLQKSMMTKIMRTEEDSVVMIPNLREVVEHEFSHPWIARMEHLDHKFWIEANNIDPLWVAKASFYKLSYLGNEELVKLSVENYKIRQWIYQKEWEELKRWSKDWGLSRMGFGREKTTYCYFAVAASCSLPHDSIVRLLVAKTAILITVADDFFDMEGSLHELRALAAAVQRWDGKGLSGHGKIIFEALDDFVSDIGKKHLHQQGSDVTEYLRDIWRETFESWMVESKWSKNGYLPSMHEYLDTGMKSIGVHTIVLPASCFLNPKLPEHELKPPHYQPITQLLMASARLLNDIQSYQKETLDGKSNLVLLHQKWHPQAKIEDSIAYAQEILDQKKRELMERALIDGGSDDLPMPSKLLHLSCLKVFQMFFNSSNRFDSETDLLDDVKRAIFVPPGNRIPITLVPSSPETKRKHFTIQASLIGKLKCQVTGALRGRRSPSTGSYVGLQKLTFPPKFTFGFI